MADDWDALAATFDDEPDHGLRDPAVRAAWWGLLEPVLPTPPAAVADLACGTGSLALLLAEHGHRVTGVDRSPAMLDRAREKVGGRVALVRGDVSDPPLPGAGFDVVLARHILFALADPVAVVGAWSRLLAPGGRLVLIEGSWSTGSGLHADEVEAIVLRHRAAAIVHPLSGRSALWGGPVDDERFMIVSAA